MINSKRSINICWFDKDLRIEDNQAILAASKHESIMPIFIYDEKLGAASKLWLHYSLISLNKLLDNKLNFYSGNFLAIFNQLANQYNIENIFCNFKNDAELEKKEKIAQKWANENNINFESFHSNYLFAQEEALKSDNSYYKVYTPFKKHVLSLNKNFTINSTQPKLNLFKDEYNTITLEKLNLLPNHKWHEQVIKNLKINNEAANKMLDDFLENKLTGYKIQRDYPKQNHTSNLSPYLHFGQITPQQIIIKAKQANAPQEDKDHFISELIWREFANHTLSNYPNLSSKNIDEKFDQFPWKKNDQHLKAWQKGKTGYPIVDAGMRQLWQTGTMHNRVRMITASFLTKNLLINWQEGEKWFFDCLFDADTASNSFNWQWVAGCGLDAAPYFRIFNPILQSKKFDAQGEYIKQFVPELSNLPIKYIHEPCTAPGEILEKANIKLGITYPERIIDLYATRNIALEEYKKLSMEIIK